MIERNPSQPKQYKQLLLQSANEQTWQELHLHVLCFSFSPLSLDSSPLTPFFYPFYKKYPPSLSLSLKHTAMDYSKFSALLLILLLSFSSYSHLVISCAVCPSPKSPGGPIIFPPEPPVIHPPVIRPPVITKPPITITLPPIIVKPPIFTPPATNDPGCNPPQAAPETCPLDTLKLGACLDILGNVELIGDPAVNQCCPLIEGLAGLEAALCLCTTIKNNLLNVNLLLPVALQLLISCGKAIPPGYTCP